MKIETANKILKKQAEFLGWSVPELMMDIKKYNFIVYSEKVIKAYEVVQYIRDVNALSSALRTPKKKHDGTDDRYVKVTFLIDSDYGDSFNIFKDIIQSNKIKEVRSAAALKSVAKSELDETTFNKISGTFQ